MSTGDHASLFHPRHRPRGPEGRVAWACAKVRSWPRQSAAVSLLAPGRGRGKAPRSAAFPSLSPCTPSPFLPARHAMPAALRLAASSPRLVPPADEDTPRRTRSAGRAVDPRPSRTAARLVQEELVLPATMEYSLLDRGHTSVRVKGCQKRANSGVASVSGSMSRHANLLFGAAGAHKTAAEASVSVCSLRLAVSDPSLWHHISTSTTTRL
jgi:hypothetical protein